jgi:predicted negative regulator of RcsB-dependent stress response
VDCRWKKEEDDYAVDFIGGDGLHERPASAANEFMSDKNTLSVDSSSPLGEISQAPPALEVFLDKHQTKIIALAIILAIGAVVYVVQRGIVQSGEETAGDLLAKAEDISDLQGVVKNHEGTAAAFSAKVLLADKQWQDGQQDDAVATLKAFIESQSGHPALASAKASLASKLLSQGKQDEAAELFREMTESPDTRYLAPYAWISLGDIESAKGNAEAAAKAYDMVSTEFPESSFARDAAQRSLLLKAKAPVEVAAPITVPEADLSGDDGGAAAPEDVKMDDLIDAVKEAPGGAGVNPLLEETPVSE